MRLLLRTLAILVIALSLVPIAHASTAAVQPEANPDDELVIITGDRRLVARDPDVPAGFRPVVWESPVTGFTNVATGDFNGDGSAEVIGLRGGEAIVYDPVPRANEPNTARVFTASAGQTWRDVVTGNLDNDSSDELILVESSSVVGLAIQMYAFKFNNATSAWNQTYGAGFGSTWQGLATGDVMGNGRDQVVAIRNPGSSRQIIIFDPADNWRTIHERNYDFPWVAVAAGNAVVDSANKDEIVTTRSGVLGTLDSMLVFRWVAGSSNLQDVAGDKFFPEFRWIALADVNGSGDDEIFLLRSGRVNNTDIVALTSRNYGSDSMVQFNQLSGQDKWRGIRAGDVDGDGKDEVIVMSSNEYLIYAQPDVSTASTSFPGSYIDNGNFAVANLDGPGTPQGPSLVVSPLTVTLNLQAGQGGSQVVNITNEGSGTLNWTANVTAGAAWLSVSQSAGTAPSSIVLAINSNALTPDSYVGRVVIDGGSGVYNSPQTITVNITITAPQFSVQPGSVSWFYQPPANPGVRSVSLRGQNVAWHAGVVPMSAATRVEQAIAAGQPIKLQDGRLLIGAGANAEDVPIVDWIDVNPVTGVATPGGIFVDLSLVLDRVSYGFNTAAVVFVADSVASPPAVVVRASALRSQPDGSDLLFLPLLIRGS
jgi:hypothetical protein